MKFKLLTFLLFSASMASYAQIDFDSYNIFNYGDMVAGPTSVYSADMDGDGIMDAIVTSRLDNKVSWYKNLDGAGTFGEQRIISTGADGARSVFVADVDNDGDMDVLSASHNDHKIAWYENMDGLGNFGIQRVITTDAYHATSVYAADLDGDGNLDVLSASQSDDKIAWYKNDDGLGNFGYQRVVNFTSGAKAVYAADIDGDGDMDILSAATNDDKIAWYENINGQGYFGPEKTISFEADGANAVFAADLDGDGDIDVLSSSSIGDKIAWYENTDGDGSFGPQRIISTLVDEPNSVYAADMDNDGDMDVLYTTGRGDDKVAFHKNNGNGYFGSQNIITYGDVANSVYAADLDGDGDLDLLSSLFLEDKIEWYENIDGNASFSTQKTISMTVRDARCVSAGDYDGDGDIDVVSASFEDDTINWYENINGNFDVYHNISTTATKANYVVSADMDLDGDLDLLVSARGDIEIFWYENDGEGHFGVKHIVSTYAKANKIYTKDIDNDGDLDVLASLDTRDRVVWYENLDGLGNFGPERPIGYSDYIRSADASDLDGDGDLDVLSVSLADDILAWHENLDGQGNFGSPITITTAFDQPTMVLACDLDMDGNNDVISTSANSGVIVWHKNDGLGNFVTQPIITNAADLVTDVFAIDIDNDGDMDLLSASENDNKIAYYENLDGEGNFGPQYVIATNVYEAPSVFSIDINNNGKYDVLAAGGNQIALYRSNLILSMLENSKLNFSIYPNPTSGIVSIESETHINIVEVYNILGQRVFSNLESDSFDISFLNNGIYFIKATDDQGIVGVKKIVKK